MVGLEGYPGDRQAGDGYRLASKGLPTFLDPEVATGEAGTTARVERIPRAYPPDVSGESVVGRSPNHGELRMLGFEVSEAAVSKYMPRHPKPPSQTWRTFLENHVGCLASTDFFVVPTATFSLLFVLVVLRHERRRIVHIGTTAHPTAAWVAQQIREAFPWETAPRYMIRDRDRVYGIAFRSRIKAMGIEEVVTAPRSPWQSPYVERVIGSIRRECLDHVIVLNERHLRAILLSYIDYYQRSRTHLALGKDTPERRSVQPAGAGKIVAFPQVGGLHHRYQRLAA